MPVETDKCRHTPYGAIRIDTRRNVADCLGCARSSQTTGQPDKTIGFRDGQLTGNTRRMSGEGTAPNRLTVVKRKNIGKDDLACINLLQQFRVSGTGLGEQDVEYLLCGPKLFQP